MKRMFTEKQIKELALSLLPNEKNLIFCGQFVYEELESHNLTPGYYCLRLKDTTNIQDYCDFYFKLTKEIESINFPFVNNADGTLNFQLGLDCSWEDNIFTMYLRDAQGNNVAVPTDYHIDIFKLA